MNAQIKKAKSATGRGLFIVLFTLMIASTASGYFIGDFVWYDANGNGIQDDGEAGVDGVIVKVYDCSGQPALNSKGEEIGAMTDWQGRYEIVLAYSKPENFILKFILPNNMISTYTFTVQDQDNNALDWVDSDVDSAGVTDCFIWPDPQIYVIDDFDAGIVKKADRCTGRIGNYVWFDTNRNGIQNPGEMGINGVDVILTDPTGLQRTTTTSTGGPAQQPGYYLFEGLCAGSYVVQIDADTVPVGYIPSPIGHGNPSNDSDDPAGTAVELPTDDSSNLTIDFGYLTPCTGRIGDYVWFDENRNGLQDSSEQGVNGVEIILIDVSGAVVMTATTFTGGPSSRPGYYLFEGLCAGEYVVAVNPDTVPQGYEPTFSPAGSDPTSDSDNPLGTVVILPNDNSSNKTIDFGYITPCMGRIGDYVWLDLNRNGVQDGTEQGINGVQVQLSNGTGQAMTATTYTGGPANRPGYYVFEGLCAGKYIVTVNPATVPAGYEPTVIGAGFKPAVDSDDPAGTVVTLPDDVSSDVTIDFGYITPCTGQVGDYVWLDANGNGIQDDGERGINGVGVRLTDDTGVVVMTVTTYTGGPANLPGYYVFDGLCAGTYTVAVDPTTVPEGHEPTAIRAPGSTTANDSDNPEGATVTLGDGERVVTIDFGYIADCADCKGGVIELMLGYLGAKPAKVVVYEGKDPKAEKTLFSAKVMPGEIFGFTGIRSDGTMSSQISIWVNGSLHTKIHTSCSQPIGSGLISGDFAVVEGYSKDGGKLCPMSDCADCDGKVTQLTLVYDDESTEPVVVVVFQKKEDDEVFADVVVPGVPFTFKGKDKDGTLGTEISILTFVGDTTVPTTETKIHTSCSQEIGRGMRFGPFLVMDGYSRNGGRFCPLESPEPAQGCGCEGKVAQLTLEYNGRSRGRIQVTQKKDGEVFDETVGPGETFTLSGNDKNGTLGTEISVYVDGVLNTKIHTSCSQPIGPELEFGNFKVIEGYSLKGGRLCPYGDDGHNANRDDDGKDGNGKGRDDNGKK